MLSVLHYTQSAEQPLLQLEGEDIEILQLLDNPPTSRYRIWEDLASKVHKTSEVLVFISGSHRILYQDLVNLNRTRTYVAYSLYGHDLSHDFLYMPRKEFTNFHPKLKSYYGFHYLLRGKPYYFLDKDVMVCSNLRQYSTEISDAYYTYLGDEAIHREL